MTKFKYEPRDIEYEDQGAIKIIRWKVGPYTDLSWISRPRYLPKTSRIWSHYD